MRLRARRLLRRRRRRPRSRVLAGKVPAWFPVPSFHQRASAVRKSIGGQRSGSIGPFAQDDEGRGRIHWAPHRQVNFKRRCCLPQPRRKRQIISYARCPRVESTTGLTVSDRSHFRHMVFLPEYNVLLFSANLQLCGQGFCREKLSDQEFAMTNIMLADTENRHGRRPSVPAGKMVFRT